MYSVSAKLFGHNWCILMQKSFQISLSKLIIVVVILSCIIGSLVRFFKIREINGRVQIARSEIKSAIWQLVEDLREEYQLKEDGLFREKKVFLDMRTKSGGWRFKYWFVGGKKSNLQDILKFEIEGRIDNENSTQRVQIRLSEAVENQRVLKIVKEVLCQHKLHLKILEVKGSSDSSTVKGSTDPSARRKDP